MGVLAVEFFPGDPARIFCTVQPVLAGAPQLSGVDYTSGLNKRFKDPSLTLFQMAWATICIMITLYFIYDLRMVVLMYYLLVMIFGAFRLRLKDFLIISALAIVGYGLVIFAIVYNQVEILNLRVEYIQWLCFFGGDDHFRPDGRQSERPEAQAPQTK